MKTTYDQAVALLEEALHLRMNGERAPGGNETWADWDKKAELYLRHASDRGLIGQVVRLKYGDQKFCQGRLLGFGTDGQFEILDESDGAVHYGWPMLGLERV